MLLYPGPELVKWGVSPWAWGSRNGYSGEIFGVMHGTSTYGSGLDVFNYFMGPYAQATSTLIIDKDGSIYQCCDPNVAHAANCCPSNDVVDWFPHGVVGADNANNWTWAIEIVKRPGNLEPVTLPQLLSCCKAVDWLCKVCGTKRHWANKYGGIMSHSFLDPVNRPGNYDPGPFDWDYLFKYLGGQMGININQVAGWFREVTINNDVRWEVRAGQYQGVQIRGGLLKRYMDFPIIPGFAELGMFTLLGLPVRSEYPHPSNVKAAVLECERGWLIHDPERVLDNPPGSAGSTYLAHMEGWVAQARELATENMTLKARIHVLEEAPYPAAIEQIRSVIEPLP